MKRQFLKVVIFSITIFIFNFGPVVAQVPPPPAEPSSVPIDGGASILAAAGVAYGVKKYRDYRKNSEEDISE